MLKGDFYFQTVPLSRTGTEGRGSIRFNRQHSVFNGHFPGLPVVPGVCMMAIVKETLEELTGQTLILESSAAIKFLALINPDENNEVNVEVKYAVHDDGKIVADGSITGTEIVFFKISKAIYR